MQNGLTKAETLEMVQAIDLIGLTLTMSQMKGEQPPVIVQDSLIMLLGGIRANLAKSYGISISPAESMDYANTNEAAIRRELSPKDVADEIIRDLQNDW